MVNVKNSAYFLLFTIFLSSVGLAFPLPVTPFNSDLDSTDVNFDNLFINYNFNAIARTKICSASVVKFNHAEEDDRALLLTNGHCIEMGSRDVFSHKMPAPGEVFHNVPVSMNVDLLSDDGKSYIGKVQADLLIFGTMTKTDMGLYRLKKTYKELRQEFAVVPLLLTDKPAPIGTSIQIISGYWKRGYSCSINGYVHTLKEGDWLFSDSIRYSENGCEVIGGTSGSPIVDANTREVIGVNNTINSGTGAQCSINNPCEQSVDGTISSRPKIGYGQHTDWLYTCLDVRGSVDLNVRGCLLPKPKSK